MTREEAKSCIGTIEMLQRLAFNIHGVIDVIDADNCKKIIKALEQDPTTKASITMMRLDYEAKLKADMVAMLDEIKAEIFNACSDSYHMPIQSLSCDEIFEIIDKYKAESEA